MMPWNWRIFSINLGLKILSDVFARKVALASLKEPFSAAGGTLFLVKTRFSAKFWWWPFTSKL